MFSLQSFQVSVLSLPPTPLPSTSHLEMIIKTYATSMSLTSSCWPVIKECALSSSHLPGLGNKFLSAFTVTPDQLV